MPGEGPYVQVPVTGVDPGTLNTPYIKALIDDFTVDVENDKSSIETYINDLQAIVEAVAPTISIPDVSDIAVPGSSFPLRPSFGELNLDDYPDTDMTAPVLIPLGNVDFEYVTPTPPDEISPDIDWTSSQYTSEMYNALFTKIHSDILNGGTGLSDSVYNAIIARERESRRLNQDREYRRGLDAVGASGFNLPSGQVAAFQRDIIGEMLAKDQDSLNSLRIKDFDLATENTRFSISSGLELEKLWASTWNAIESRGFEAAKASAGFIISAYEVNVKKYLAEWEAIGLELQALKTKIDAIVASNDGEIKVFLGQVEVYEKQITAVASKNNSIVDVRKGEIDIYSTEVTAASNEYDGAIKGMAAQLDKARLEITSVIEGGKFDLSVFSDKNKLASDIGTAVSQITAQIVASTLGAINTQLSSGYTGSAAISERTSHTATITETHSYKEGE